MNKDIANKLREKAKEIAKNFSNPDREFNANKETFEVESITPLSEATAVSILVKNTGKKALVFLYYVNGNGGYWAYFFPRETHVYGMQKLVKYLQEIEEANFPFNFEEAKLGDFA